MSCKCMHVIFVLVLQVSYLKCGDLSYLLLKHFYRHLKRLLSRVLRKGAHKIQCLDIIILSCGTQICSHGLGNCPVCAGLESPCAII